MAKALLLGLSALALSVAPAREDVELRWRGKPGDVQRHRVVSSQEFQSPMGPIKTEYALVVRQEVKAVSPAGVGSVDLRYEAFKLASAGPMAMDFDSTRTGDAAKKNPADVAKQFATLAAATVHLEIEPSGRVAKIEGLAEASDQAFGKASASMMGGSGTLRAMFSEEALKRLVEVQSFPSEKVAVGATWPRSQEVKAQMLGTLKFTSQNKLAALEPRDGKTCARIEIDGEVKLEPGADGASPVAFSLDDSDYQGTAVIAVDSGYLLELTTSSVLDLSFSMGGGEGQTMSVKTEQHILALPAGAPAFE